MKRYILNFNSREMEVTESNAPFTSKDGMLFSLPNNTEIFITKDCINQMSNLSGEFGGNNKGVSIDDQFSSAVDAESSESSPESFEKDGR